MDIQKILNDLYAMEPELRSREQEVIKIINELLASRPDTKFDEKFRLALRERLLTRANELEAGARLARARPARRFQPLSWLFIGAGAAASVLLVFSFVKNNIRPGLFDLKNAQTSVTKLADNAFGNLLLEEKAAAGATAGPDAAAPAPAQKQEKREIALGSPAPSAPVAAYGRGSAGVATGIAEPGKTIAPDYPVYDVYKYAYKGEPIMEILKQVQDDNGGQDDSGTMQVLKRIKGGDASFGQLSSLLSGARLGIDWNKFSGIKVQNISFSENRDRGYSVYVDLNESSVSINQNWSNWTRSSDMVVSPEYYKPLRVSDLPGDDKIIAAADKFLRDYGIPTDSYGPPEIQKDWLIGYGVAAVKDSGTAEYYAPDSLTVIYPLKVEGKNIYEESGYKSGLSVAVNAHGLTVQNVYNLTSQQYESSGYAAEKDASRLQKLAEAGGWRQEFYAAEQGPNARVVKIELGTPSVELVKIWTYKDNASQELLVPSLIFPITKKPTNAYFYQKNIIVPLIKDILTNF
ncbi:hypothetical protein EPN28_02280 [Patescibacteria group bacterium]|nr:MAG: hypothetical protein EPN28_02280 [Patescibacteria group bacterium]